MFKKLVEFFRSSFEKIMKRYTFIKVVHVTNNTTKEKWISKKKLDKIKYVKDYTKVPKFPLQKQDFYLKPDLIKLCIEKEKTIPIDKYYLANKEKLKQKEKFLEEQLNYIRRNNRLQMLAEQAAESYKDVVFSGVQKAETDNKK